MPLNLEKCTASHCTEFTGAVTFTKKSFPPCFRLILKARTHCLPLFRPLAPRLVPFRTSVFTTAGQIGQSGRNAIRPRCSIHVFKRVGKIILTKQIIGQSGRNAIDNFFRPIQCHFFKWMAISILTKKTLIHLSLNSSN